MAKQILRIEAIHSNQAFAAKMKHNYRIGNVPNADKNARHLNEQIIKLPVGEKYNSFFEKKISELPYYDNHKIRKNAIRGFEVLMSYGQGVPEDFSQEKWKKQAKQFLIDEFGKENIASAVLHMDEGTPHIHAIIVPIKDGRLNGTAYFKDRQAVRDFHSRCYDYMRECGLEAENKYMQITHEKTGIFYNNINLAMEQELPSIQDNESLESYVVRANEFYKEQMLRSLGKTHQVAQLSKEKAALESANKTIEKITSEKYEHEIKEIMSEIGSVANAKHAIQYRDSLQEAIEWTSKTNPDLADSVVQIITNMQHGYEKAMEEQREEENVEHN